VGALISKSERNVMRHHRPVSASVLGLLAAACSSTTPPATTTGDSGPGTAGAGEITFAASGEVLALTGYTFPPATPSDPAFVDGWDVHFDRLLVTIDKITLSANPDTMMGDQSKTGAVVAEIDGPWAVDLSRSAASNLPGKGGTGEEAVPIAKLTNQNKNGGAPFATDGTRYAFGFDIVPASAAAQKINLDAAATTDYQEMTQKGCALFYAGTATFKGDDACNMGHTDWPKTVHFRLCFKSSTSYVNCQNPDNDPAMAFDGEEHQRGIAFPTNSGVVGQVTIHTDHPFWDSTVHDSPAHFDQFAARVVGVDAGAPTVTLEDTVGVDYTAYTDALGRPVDWRYCVEPPTDAHPKVTGAMAFNPGSVPHAIGNDPATGLRDYYDFATYNQSTQGHLSSDGLCFVRRNYASPP
jgi:hypothetical protein